ncbi:hypothetical protein FBUS_08800 [Fasciolopsis buskii]|uniref:DAAF9 N-terminal domain-containing protein n=1 Tax=Fasciolopsis buskii TaxID=27845 RepID=A0A8E0RPC8_9TREM|nr:hypothetical protein FBUS_08800 [Fasciolopsis buski]
MLRKLQFTRRDIPQTQFSSYLRLNNFRTLMLQNKCDAFLIILGVDAKFNCGSMLAASYLLFDMFETREADMNQSKFDMDTFEDLIICIRPSETHVYCNVANYGILLPYISPWPNLRIHCVNETDLHLWRPGFGTRIGSIPVEFDDDDDEDDNDDDDDDGGDDDDGDDDDDDDNDDDDDDDNDD